jgi:ribonuclease Z
MPLLKILGTSLAIPQKSRENTHMALLGEKRLILVDSAHNPVIHLQDAGIDILSITDLILTHFHPDHVSGVPSLIMSSWLLGRKKPLEIYGLSHTIDRLASLMVSYDWESWPNLFQVNLHRLPEEELFMFISDDEFRIFSSPVCHMIPTIGLRFEFPISGKTLAYSCDTEPCPSLQKLGYGADLLIHEATGEGIGHSSALQAGMVANQVQAKELMLIHYQAEGDELIKLINDAKLFFTGNVVAAMDLQSIDF